MTLNQKFDSGDTLALPVPAGTAAGTPVLVGALAGVTRDAEGTGGNPAGFATVDLVGSYQLTVSGAVATYGLAVYITAAGALTTTATGNTLFGYSLGTKAAGTGPLLVRTRRKAA